MKGHPQPGPRFYDSGYKILELGPDGLKGKGDAEMVAMVGSVLDARGAK